MPGGAAADEGDEVGAEVVLPRDALQPVEVGVGEEVGEAAVVVTHDVEGGLDEGREALLVYAVPVGELLELSVPLGFAEAAEVVRDLLGGAAVDVLGVLDEVEDVVLLVGQVAV